MVKRILTLAIVLMMGISSVWAYDFSAVAPSGQRLYYDVYGNHAIVTYPSRYDIWYAWYDTMLVGSLTIPTTVTHGGHTYTVTAIDDYAFSGCNDLTSVTIGDSVTYIGAYAFHCCRNLVAVRMPNTVTTIARDAFSRCTSLGFIDIPDSLTYIGQYAFCLCRNLTSVNIPEGLTHIYGGTFADCSGLTSVTIPASVTSIGDSAFFRCTGLTEITSRNTTAPSVYDYTAFWGIDTSITVNIPCGSYSSYAARWSYFHHFSESLLYAFSAISDNTSLGMVEIQKRPTCDDSRAVIKAVPSQGCTFLRWSDGSTESNRVLNVTENTELIAFFSDGTQGIDTPADGEISIHTIDESFSITGVDGQDMLVVDETGRVILHESVVEGRSYRMPHKGIYLVKLGTHPAQKIVVTK